MPESNTTAAFWKLFDELPREIQQLARQKFDLFLSDPHHPSLGFKRKGKFWTVDIGRSYRAIALGSVDRVVWFWIGSHEDYNNVLGRK